MLLCLTHLPVENHLSLHDRPWQWFPVHSTGYVPGWSGTEAHSFISEQLIAFHDQVKSFTGIYKHRLTLFWNPLKHSSIQWMFAITSGLPLHFLNVKLEHLLYYLDHCFIFIDLIFIVIFSLMCSPYILPPAITTLLSMFMSCFAFLLDPSIL